MLDLTEFSELQFREEDFADARPVDFDGASIAGTIPEKWERLMRGNAKARELWDATYDDKSRQAYALMGLAGWLGLSKGEAAELHVAYYARFGRKEDGIRKAPYALRAWERGRLKSEAYEAGAGNGRAPDKDLEEPSVEAGASAEIPREGPSERFTLPLSKLLSVPDEPVPYLVERLLVQAANGFIGGEPKSLKSWLALYIALCLSLGVAVFSRYPVPKRVRVLLISEEDGNRRVRRRIRKLLAGMGMNAPEDGFFRYAIKAGVLLDDPKWIARLRGEIAEYQPAIVIGDVFELMHGRDGDKRAEMKPVFRNLDRLREEFGCSFLLADHFKKAGIGVSRRGGQRLSGTVGKHAFGECSLYLFPAQGANRVRVETELKDGPSEVFGLALEDTEEGGVRFAWQAEAEDREAGMKAKALGAIEGLALDGSWVTAKTVADAMGVAPNTATKYLNLLVDEDRKLEREKLPTGKTKAWHWRLRAI